MVIDVIILAAGKGSRMYSSTPKVLHPIAGKPMAAHVLAAAKSVSSDILVHMVIGHGAQQVRDSFQGESGLSFIEQTEQLGTGHAVLQALPAVREESKALILYGDVPLIQPETLQQMVTAADADKAMSLLTITMDDPTGYGRIVRDQYDEVISIVEQKDAHKDQLEITEVNTGIMCIKQRDLANWLPSLSNENAQGEYYLTDVIEMAVRDEVIVTTIQPKDESEVTGVNSKSQLAGLERVYQRQLAENLLVQGVSLFDPERLDIRGHLTVGNDVSIDVNCVFIGNVHLADGVSIGPNCVIEESTIGAGTEIKAFCHIEGSNIEEQCAIGPYARLRPGTELLNKAKIGNFVEIKKSVIREASKVNHLSYIGDADIGSGSNVGAGTITCNYDGANKFKTVLGSNVFVGSNSTLVAPLEIKDNGFVGAGSTITQTVPESSLAVGRGKQKNIDGWKRPTKK